jgi:hypothetical protein
LSSYVALKIHIASNDVESELALQKNLVKSSIGDPDSNFVVLASDSFSLKGPNGKHHCFVMELMGPSISAVLGAPHKEYDALNPPSHRFPTQQNKRSSAYFKRT